MHVAERRAECAISRRELLAELGYGHPAAQRRAVEILAAVGLVNPRREGMAGSKRDACQELLAKLLVRLCDACVADGTSRDVREPVPVEDRNQCEGCQGSRNRAAIQRAAEVFTRRGLSRLVVVGGSPGVHQALRHLWPLQLRIVDGTVRHVEREALSNLAWADVVAVWASTELNHTVSNHYTSARARERATVAMVSRRGIEALGDALVSLRLPERWRSR